MAYLSITVIDTNPTTIALTGEEAYLIKYHSDAEATMELKQGVMNLDACVIENGSERVYETSHTFYNVESSSFLFACADADDVSYEEKISVPMVDYVKLTCNIDSSVIDGDGNVEIKCKGNSFNGSFGAVTNEVTAKCRYKEITGAYSDWHDMYVTTNGKAYAASVDFSDLDYEKNYTFEVKVTDKLEEATARRTVSSKPLFHWGKGDFTFEVPVNAKDIRLKSDSKNYGHYLRFGDGDYCYLAEETDDSLVIYASNGIDLQTTNGNVYVNGSPLSQGESGEWHPYFEDEGAIGSEFARQGWYSKVGNVVTIGFYIKAYCNSGYEDVQIALSGLPYTPICDASGGGMCSGAYVAGGYNFQCFVVDTDGIITIRVQKCNNTSDSNLGTSASGCCYSNNEATLTLSGTITYITGE